MNKAVNTQHIQKTTKVARAWIDKEGKVIPYTPRCLGPFNHPYTKWKGIEGGDVVVREQFGLFEGEKKCTGAYIIQQRTCRACGRTNLRTVQTTI